MFTGAFTRRQNYSGLASANKQIAALTAERIHQEIVRDLHDTLTQNIIGINMQLSVIEMLNKSKRMMKLQKNLPRRNRWQPQPSSYRGG